jgi:ParB family chromosome partitioning protein
VAGRKSDFSLPTLDDLFSSQEERDAKKNGVIREIPIELIDNFPNHPFKVKDDEEMFKLVDSVKTNGVLTPAILRPKENGRYEMVSGHRRKRACELAQMDTIRCEVRDLTDDEATILMVESNYHRPEILPSEKAFAYKMRLEAMKRQGKRTDLTSATPLQKSGKTSREILAEESGESHEQIRKYIRLTYLIPKLLDLVDEGSIKMRPAVELSYLNEDFQKAVFEEIELNLSTPSHAQAIRLRKMQDEGTLSTQTISEIMCEEKPNQKERIVLSSDRVRKLIPKNVTLDKTEDYVCKALEYYAKYQKRLAERDSR